MTDPTTEIAERVAAKGVTRVAAGKTGRKPAAKKTAAAPKTTTAAKKPATPKTPIGARRFADDAKIAILVPIDQALTPGRKNHTACSKIRDGMTVAEALKIEGGPNSSHLNVLADRGVIAIK
jgi:hypothetical protein